MSTKCKLTPVSGGTGFELPNVTTVAWSVTRPSNGAGTIARDGFEVGIVKVSRFKSLQDSDGKAKPESEAVDVACKRGERAYMKGEVTIAQADKPTNILQTVRWNRGFISSISNEATVDQDGGTGIEEEIEFTVTGLVVNNAKFERTHV